VFRGWHERQIYGWYRRARERASPGDDRYRNGEGFQIGDVFSDAPVFQFKADRFALIRRRVLANYATLRAITPLMAIVTS